MNNSVLRAKAKRLLAKWQKNVKIGDTVEYFAYPGASLAPYKVKSDAFLCDNDTDAVVFLEGFSGYVCLENIKFAKGEINVKIQ